MMQRPNGAGMALFALLAAALAFATAALLPFFMRDVWAPLWGVEQWGAGAAHSLTRLGPLAGVSQWPMLLVIPLASCLVLAMFLLFAGSLALLWRGSATRPR